MLLEHYVRSARAKGAQAFVRFGVARFLVSIASIVGFGCAGAASQDLFDSNPTPVSSGANPSGENPEAGTLPGNGGVDASVTPSDAGNTCPQELEPNDSRLSANLLLKSLCGSIQPATESDFLTFQLAPTTTSMQINFDGKVTLQVDVDGTTVILGNGGNPKVPFVKGKRYIIEVTAIGHPTTSVPWRVDLVEK